MFQSLKREDGYLVGESDRRDVAAATEFQSLKREDGYLAGNGYFEATKKGWFQSLKREDGHLAQAPRHASDVYGVVSIPQAGRRPFSQTLPLVVVGRRIL